MSSYLTNDCSEQQPSEAADAGVLVTAGRKHTDFKKTPWGGGGGGGD